MFPVTNQKAEKQIFQPPEKAKHPIKNSKNRPRLYNYLKYSFLIAFVVLLVVQLCSNELSGAIAATTFKSSKFNISTDVTKHNSINFIDPLKDEILGVARVNEIDPQHIPGNGSNKSSAPPFESTILTEAVSKVSNQTREAKFDRHAQNLANGDLVAAPTAQATQVNAVHCSDPDCSSRNLQLNSDHLAQLDTSLAEITAAGTAAGLLVHDLLSQANTIPEHDVQLQTSSHSFNDYLPPIGDQGTTGVPYAAATRIDLDDNEAPLGFEARQIEQPIYNSIPQHRQRAIESLDEADDEAEQASDEQHQGAQYNPEKQNRGSPRDYNSAPLERSAVEHAESMPEPPGEDQMPDSMDSLMKSEGESVDDDANRDQRQPQMDGSTLVNQNRHIASIADDSAQMFPVLNGMQDKDEEIDSDNDDEKGPSESIKIAQEFEPNSLHDSLHQDYNPTFMNSISDQLRTKAATPLSDSLLDLNTAAGHYYGKKKKKKVKKLVIKKKKKKKKKYVKKKVKVVKIVHKKKKKPKKKKHHDHGHYYMYAKVPKKKTWEFGFKKGNKKHWIMRHEKGHKNKFKTKVKWYDKKSKGKGVHIWDYNHHDKKKKKHY